jgi:hypothetical protein
MKIKILAIFLGLAMVSCYNEYVKDFDYTGVYFAYQTNVRTVVVGEGMKIEVGPALGGEMVNSRDRLVTMSLDNSLLTNGMLLAMQNSPVNSIKNYVTGLTMLTLLPADYYTMSGTSVTIKKGQNSAAVVIRPDSVKFLSDPGTLMAKYVLPLRIISADADSVLRARNFTVIGLRYENMLFGNYIHGGVTIRKNASTGLSIDTAKYYTTIPQSDAKSWALTTITPSQLVTNGISNIAGSFKITLNGGSIVVSQAAGSTVVVQPDGVSTFNQSKLLQDRKILLSYKYANADGSIISYARDTLTFRNRIRDGVNEWLDENPVNYK